MQSEPLVTVVVVSYNHARFVEQALDAVAAQTHPRVQVIVLDDASTDGAPEVIRSYLDRTGLAATFVAHERNLGLVPTLNEALGLLDPAAEFLAIIAADDWMEPIRLERQLDRFAECGPEVAVVHADMHLVDESGTRQTATYHPEGSVEGDVFGALVLRNRIAAPAALVRRSVRDEIGPFDESLWAEDFDTWLRIARDHEFAYVDEPLVNYRITSTSMTQSVEAIRIREGRVVTLRKHLGARPEFDDRIHWRVEQLLVLMYLDGRSPALSAHDLRHELRHSKQRRTFVYFALASLRVPGSWVARIAGLARRVKGGQLRAGRDAPEELPATN